MVAAVARAAHAHRRTSMLLLLLLPALLLLLILLLLLLLLPLPLPLPRCFAALIMSRRTMQNIADEVGLESFLLAISNHHVRN